MDSETHHDFLTLLYKILSFKCELDMTEIEILIYKFYNKKTDKQISRLIGIHYEKVSQVYSNIVSKIRG